MPFTPSQPNFETRMEGEIAQAKEHLLGLEETLANYRLKNGDRGVCPVSLSAHTLVTFHSNPAEHRLVCLDCSASFRDDDDVLTRQHGRSRLGAAP